MSTPRHRYPATAVLLALGLAFPVAAQEDIGGGEVALRSGTIQLSPAKEGLGELATLAAVTASDGGAEAAGGPIRVILQFAEIPDEARKLDLEEEGVRVLQFIGNNAFVATILDGGLEALAVATSDAPPPQRVVSIEPMAVAYKLEASVAERRIGEWAVEGDVARLRIEHYSDADATALAKVIEEAGGSVLDRSDAFDRMTVEIPADFIEEVGALNGVSWIEPVAPPREEFNDSSRARVGADTLATQPFGLTGAGIRVGVWDGGRIDGHGDFGTRLNTQRGDLGASVSNHATHVAGTVAADGAGSAGQGGTAGQWAGVAAGATLYSWDFFGDTADEVVIAVDDAQHGIDLSTNSWGWRIEGVLNNCALYGDYPGEARDYDRIVNGAAATRPLPVLFAAGNERNDGDCGMMGPPFDNYAVVSPPGTAKNVITVGAANSNDDTMTTFSSWGPVDDGRIKPDVTAPGCQSNGDTRVTSTMPGGVYGGMCGTSMATPATAGIVALLLEHHDAVLQTAPLPSTLKALLIQTAVDLGRPGPDYAFGYGRIDGVAAVEAITARQMSEGLFNATGNDTTSTFNVTAGTSELRATLAWDDAAAAANVAQTLVNDLDLRLTDPSGTVHQPFILNTAVPDADALRGNDAVNNVEQVLVAAPQAGQWTATVRAARIAQGPQTYSLVLPATAATPPPPPPVADRYIYTTLRVITAGASRGCGVSDWDCMTRLCRQDLSSAAWRGWAGCNPEGSDFICYFECAEVRRTQ